MAYTQTDLDNIRAAILALANGERATAVTLSSGKSITYGQASLPELRALEASVASSVAVATGSRKKFVMASTGKGF